MVFQPAREGTSHEQKHERARLLQDLGEMANVLACLARVATVIALSLAPDFDVRLWAEMPRVLTLSPQMLGVRLEVPVPLHFQPAWAILLARGGK